MKYSVISIEDGIVVLEDESGALFTLAQSNLPESLTEGQLVDLTDNGFVVDKLMTSAERRRIFDKFNSIKNKKN